MNEEQQRRQAAMDIQRAEEAKELLSNPLIQEFFISMKAAHFEEFQSAKWDDDQLRRELSQRMRLLNQFESKFQSVIKQGNKAKTTLQLITDKVKRVIG
jgi:hypothetical protein